MSAVIKLSDFNILDLIDDEFPWVDEQTPEDMQTQLEDLYETEQILSQASMDILGMLFDDFDDDEAEYQLRQVRREIRAVRRRINETVY